MSEGRLRLAIFDVDGTLVDSQADILASMARAFAHVAQPMPDRDTVLGIVGLSLPEAMARLVPDLPEDMRAQMVTAYKGAYVDLRKQSDVTQSSPFYPGARAVLEQLNAQPDVLLGVATGKSRRGLDKLLEAHDLSGLFVTRQVSDFHPSKPHPSMIETALAQAGVLARDAVMIGDTTYDMQMGRNAGVSTVGVSWGYHARADLTDADVIIDDFAALPGALQSLWESDDE